MFSDSLLIWGDDAEGVLPKIQKAYLILVENGILIRGAMVKGRLSFEPRLTLDNFSKNLPPDDTLARAVGLEKTQKGARLLIENSLAKELLQDRKEWLTHEGYVDKTGGFRDSLNILRRIAPTPDNSTYEVLYFWTNNQKSQNVGHHDSYKELKDRLRYFKKQMSNDLSSHYEETLSLIDRSISRLEITRKKIGISSL